VGVQEKRGKASFDIPEGLFVIRVRGFFRMVTFDLDFGMGSIDETLVLKRATGESEASSLVNSVRREASRVEEKGIVAFKGGGESVVKAIRLCRGTSLGGSWSGWTVRGGLEDDIVSSTKEKGLVNECLGLSYY